MCECMTKDTRSAADELICACCNCKRIRIAEDDWREGSAQAGARLTHGICPDCLYELYPEIAPLVRPRQKIEE